MQNAIEKQFYFFLSDTADGAHKQSISRNQHQSRLKHLSQSGTRQVKAQRRLSSAPLSSGSVRFSSVAAVRLPHNSIKRRVNTANTPRCLHAPTTTSPPHPSSAWGNCSCLLSQSVSESDAQQTQTQPLAVARNGYSAVFTVFVAHCSRFTVREQVTTRWQVHK